MITILKSGTQKRFKHICTNCGCEFTFHTGDTIVHYNSKAKGIKREITIKCPECTYPYVVNNFEDFKEDSE